LPIENYVLDYFVIPSLRDIKSPYNNKKRGDPSHSLRSWSG